MTVKILYKAPTLPDHMVAEMLDGRLMGFYVTPIRHITEKDLMPFPGYQAKGRSAEEAQGYFYTMYGLTKGEQA